MVRSIIRVFKEIMSKKPYQVSFSKSTVDPIIDGPMAHEYTNPIAINEIERRYREVHPFPEQTPWTHPWLFSPINPPSGWSWDPYYEVWIKASH